jgi:hypothetical protein
MIQCGLIHNNNLSSTETLTNFSIEPTQHGLRNAKGTEIYVISIFLARFKLISNKINIGQNLSKYSDLDILKCKEFPKFCEQIADTQMTYFLKLILWTRSIILFSCETRSI